MALTQIHGNRQILDGTIKDADIAGDAAITNSKLSLASIAQAVTLTHPNGLRLEAFDTQILLRDTAVTLPDGLWRVKDTSGNLDFAVNRAVAGDFSVNKIVLRLVNFAGGTGDRIDVFSLLQTTNDIRLQSAEPAVILRETDQVLPAGLYRVRLAGDSLRFERNTAVAGDFSLLDTDIEIQPNNISLNKGVTLTGAPFLIQAADVQLRLRETDKGVTAGGLWRIRVIDTALSFEVNTALAGDFSSQVLAMNLSTASGDVEVFTPFRVNKGVKFQSGQPAGSVDDFTLYRDSGDSDRLHYRQGAINKALAYLTDITTVTTPDIHEGGVRILGLLDPGTPTVTPQGTPGTTTWSYRVSAVGPLGTETLASEAGAGTTATGNAVLSATNFNRITWTSVPDATAYKVYRVAAGGTPNTTGLLATVNAPTTQFDDTGIAAAGGTPTLDTTSSILLRNPNRNPNVGALYRLLDALALGGQTILRLDVNTAIAGDFSAFNTLVSFSTTETSFHRDVRIGDGGHVLLVGSRPTVEFADAFSGAGAANGEMWRQTESLDALFIGRLKFFSPQSGATRDIAVLQDFAVREVPTGVVDGANTAFVLARTPVAGTEQVYLNGLLQSAGAAEDYTISGKTITFNNPPQLGDKIRVTYLFKSQ